MQTCNGLDIACTFEDGETKAETCWIFTYNILIT
jgi:hypothetical protein